MTLDRADAAWVGPVCAVLWGCKTVPCVSLCVWVFFDDDKLLSAPMVSARIVPAPTNVPAMGDSVSSRQRPSHAPRGLPRVSRSLVVVVSECGIAGSSLLLSLLLVEALYALVVC